MLVGGEKPQGSQRSRMILARVGGRNAKDRQLDLGVRRLLLESGGTGLTVGGLRGSGGPGGALGDSGGLRGVGRSLPTVRLEKQKNK